MRWIPLFLCFVSAAAWAGLGKLAYLSNDTLWVRALPDGAPVAVAKGTDIAYPEWSADGTWLTYFDQAGHLVYKVVRADGQPAPALPMMAEAVWSPTAAILAYTTNKGGLFLYDCTAQKTRTLVSPAANELSHDFNLNDPVTPDDAKFACDIHWASDGKTLAYATRRGSLTLADVETGKLTVVQQSAPGKMMYGCAWSRNGHTLAYWVGWATETDDNHFVLHRVDADGSDRRLLYDNGKDTPEPLKVIWSGDGRYLLFYRAGEKLGPGILAVSVDGGKPTIVAGSTTAATLPCFSPDGRLTAIFDLLSPDNWHGQRLALAQLPERERAFSPREVYVESAAWSPDGRTLACVTAPEKAVAVSEAKVLSALEQRRIVLTPATEWKPLPLRTGSPFREENPQWSHDGTQLMIVRIDPKTGEATLWLATADGNAARRITNALQPLEPSEEDHWLGGNGQMHWEAYYAWWQSPPPVTVQTPGLEYGGISYLPLRATVQALGGTMDLTQDGMLRVDLPGQEPHFISTLSYYPRIENFVYMPARDLASHLDLKLTAGTGTVQLSSDRSSVTVPVSHSPELEQRAAAVQPLVFNGIYLGGLVKSRWRSSEEMLPDGALMHDYTVYTLAGPHGSFRGGGVEMNDFTDKPVLKVSVQEKQIEKDADLLALSAPWNAMPHVPEKLKQTDARAVALARAILSVNRLPNAVVTVRQAYLADLGDGVPTLIISVRSQGLKDGKDPKPGDYAFVAVSRNDKPQLLEGKFFTKAAGEAESLDKQLVGVLDVDHDGLAEIIAVEYGYEWTTPTVYRLKDGAFLEMK